MSVDLGWIFPTDIPHRRVVIYDSMEWNQDPTFELRNYVVVGASFGGPLALYRYDPPDFSFNAPPLEPNNITVFTNSGKRISPTTTLPPGRVIHIGWSDQETLICLLDTGLLLQYSVHGELISRLELFRNREREEKVMEAKSWGNGIVVMTETLNFYAIHEFRNEAKLPRPNLVAPPTCWVVVPPNFPAPLGLMIADERQKMWIIRGDSIIEQSLPLAPIRKMALSPGPANALACYCDDPQVLVILSLDLTPITKMQTKAKLPSDLVWCEGNAVVMCWDTISPNNNCIVLVVCTDSNWTSFVYQEPVKIVGDQDGVRIITKSKCEYFQRVPAVIEDIFKPASVAPHAMLVDALSYFQNKNSKADEYIREIKSELSDAVDQCIDAAAHEWELTTQQTLLRAASFGKCFLEGYYSDLFVEMCKTLRVLNSVRHPDIGMPLSYQQYKLLNTNVLIARLINLHHHYLAYKICNYLKIKPNQVLVHWACAKVKSSTATKVLAEEIVEKMNEVPGISYAEVASTAFKNGRVDLATKLLDYEPRAADQVPLLLRMQHDPISLTKALESGDTDLVYLVLLHMKRIRTQQEFTQILQSQPDAMDLMIVFFKTMDIEQLKQLYQRLGRPADLAHLALIEAVSQRDFLQRAEILKRALSLYSESKTHSFHQKTCEEEIKLLLLQKDLALNLHREFEGLSLTDTLHTLVSIGQMTRAQKIRSDFKVPDKRFWWIVIRGLARAKDWRELEKFSKDKKSPIGYEPFAEVCLEAGRADEAAQYIQKVSDPTQKAELFIKISKWQEAADAAREAKDPDLLRKIRNRCDVPAVWPVIDNYLSQLR